MGVGVGVGRGVGVAVGSGGNVGGTGVRVGTISTVGSGDGVKGFQRETNTININSTMTSRGHRGNPRRSFVRLRRGTSSS
ncbi:MAG TPA: hypothetical protein EYP55_10105 [Anaerolineae bacterium]|nr:hypothetical protein [Anaerolineae bacterium]